MLPSANISLSQFLTPLGTRPVVIFFLYFITVIAQFTCYTNEATVHTRTGMLGHAPKASHYRSRTHNTTHHSTTQHSTLIRDTATWKMWLCCGEHPKRKNPEMKDIGSLALEIRKWMRSLCGFRASVDPDHPVNRRSSSNQDAGSTDRSAWKGESVLRAIPMTNSGGRHFTPEVHLFV